MTGQAIVAFVTLKGGKTARSRSSTSCAITSRKDRPDREAREYRLYAGAPEDAQRQDHAAALRDVAENRPLGDTTTLADATVVDELRNRSVEEAEKEA